MRRSIATVLAVCALALPYASATSAAVTAPRVKVVTKVTTQTVTGPAIEASRWGSVQVTLVVRRTATTKKTTTNGKTTSKTTVANAITSLDATYSFHSERSQFIMGQAVPMLKQEVLAANSANVQMISRATDTSEAFLSSLQSAIAQVS